MNRIKTIVIFLFILILSLPLTQAQKPVAKEKALNFLLKTNRLIGHAHMAVKRGKVYTGNLGKAVRHERYAKKLYAKGMYLQSIQHSRRARLLALEAIKVNKVKPTSDANITPEETELIGTAPSDQELDDALAKEKIEEIKDEDLINSNNLDLGVK
jgi:hypothetical protein